MEAAKRGGGTLQRDLEKIIRFIVRKVLKPTFRNDRIRVFYHLKNDTDEEVSMELWDLYDENRNLLNKIHVRGTEMPEGAYHLVSDVWTVTTKGQVLISQRHPGKPYGLLWECNGGAVQIGETGIEGALRELSEEVGIRTTAERLIPIHSIKLVERFVDTYITMQDIRLEDLVLQTEEVVDARLVSFEELNAMWEQGLVVPKIRFRLYRDKIREFIEDKREKEQ